MAKFFSRLDPHVQRISGWLTVVGAALSAVYAVIAKAAPLFEGLNWAGATLVGIALALATMLAMAFIFFIIGAAFRFFRPLPKAEAEPNKVGIRLPADGAEVKARLDDLQRGFAESAKVLQGMMTAQTEMNEAFRLRTETVERAAKGAKDYAEGASVAHSQLLKEHGEKVEAQIVTALTMIGDVQKLVIDETKELRERVAKWERLYESQADRFDHRLENIDAAFAALANRDWHRQLYRELEEAFEALAKPVDEGQGITNGSAWIQEAKNWRGKLDQWLTFADYYCVGTANRVLTVPEHIYESDHWRFDEKALNATQVHRFKEVAIWWHNAQEAKPKVDAAFVRALQAPSKHGRVDAPPRMSSNAEG